MDDQPVLIATVGIPASGKTTWAKEQQARYPTLVRVNKDDLRAMLNDGVWSQDNEKLVCSIRDEIIALALSQGRSVICDDTHVFGTHLLRLNEIASVAGARFSTKVFVTPLDVCLERNARRPSPVPAKVIREMDAEMQRKVPRGYANTTQ